MRTVSLREINQNTSGVLRSISGTDDVVVTDRGEPRWQITAVAADGTTSNGGTTSDGGTAGREIVILRGEHPRGTGSLKIAKAPNRDTLPRIRARADMTSSEILAELRADR